MKVSLNGRIISEETAHIHIKDRGFLLGDGIFETCKVQNGHIEFFDEHYARLNTSAKALSIPMTYAPITLKNLCLDLIKENKLENVSTAMRISLTRGLGLRGIDFSEKSISTLLITTNPYSFTGMNLIRAMITSVTRNPSSIITKHKTLNYLEPIMARQEARSKGFDEGIMCNINGYIAECSVANIFFIKNDKILTPSLETGILPGIMRNHVINTLKTEGYSIIEKLISIDEAINADEAFQTNSLIGIQSISHINEKEYLLNFSSDIKKKIFHSNG